MFTYVNCRPFLAQFVEPPLSKTNEALVVVNVSVCPSHARFREPKFKSQ